MLALAMTDEPSFRYTEAEAAMLAALANTRVRADSGDRKAKKQIAKLSRQIVLLTRKSRRGDARAARQLRVLQESGLLEPSQVFAMDGVYPLDQIQIL
jgi:septal ring factor EnvC (AmiA/AmiB activator)